MLPRPEAKTGPRFASLHARIRRPKGEPCFIAEHLYPGCRDTSPYTRPLVIYIDAAPSPTRPTTKGPRRKPGRPRDSQPSLGYQSALFERGGDPGPLSFKCAIPAFHPPFTSSKTLRRIESGPTSPIEPPLERDALRGSSRTSRSRRAAIIHPEDTVEQVSKLPLESVFNEWRELPQGCVSVRWLPVVRSLLPSRLEVVWIMRIQRRPPFLRAWRCVRPFLKGF